MMDNDRTQPRRRLRLAPAQRVPQILDAALQEFSRRGFTAARMDDIAQRCGFASMATFTRAFKAAYGVTPAALRSVSALNPTRPNPHDAALDDGLGITRWMHEITADNIR